jgi:5-methylcytosine-specific restriction endonuclease McrA
MRPKTNRVGIRIIEVKNKRNPNAVPRTKINIDWKTQIFESLKYRCWYCGEHLNDKNKTIDHVIPYAHGGTNDTRNLVPACLKCNREKDNMLLKEYRAFIKKKYNVRNVIFFAEKLK